MKNFSERLIARRNRLGLTQQGLALKAKLSPSSVSALERGLNPPTGRTLEKLNKVLGEPGEWLYTTPFPPVSNARVEPLKETFQARRVPVISWASAGAGGNFSDNEGQIDEFIECDCMDRNAYALILEGDSMLPKFEPGDRVVFLPNSEPRNGDVVVARLRSTGEVLFKLYHANGPSGTKVRLTSFNPAYPPLEFSRNEFRFIHPLHGMWRPRGR